MKFVMFAHKPKAMRLAKHLANGAGRMGHDFIIKQSPLPVPNSVGIFYGVTPEFYSTWQFYRAENKAIYLDNGWLTTPENVTFRFAWNGAQTHLQDMPLSDEWEPELAPLPDMDWNPCPNDVMLVLQSRMYFDNMRVGYDRDQWERVTTSILEQKGYEVFPREKPTKKEPEDENFFDHMARCGIVVSANSAATVKALRYGIPAFCTLPSTPSPVAPVRIPDAGRAAPPNPDAVETMCARMWSYEITPEQMNTGVGIERMLEVPHELRRGIWYGN